MKNLARRYGVPLTTAMALASAAWVILLIALPYFLLMVLAVVLLYLVPGLVTWLPGQMIGQ